MTVNTDGSPGEQAFGVTPEVCPRDWTAMCDRLRAHPDSTGYVLGHMKEFIKRGGANVSPTEVEDVLTERPIVREMSVSGLWDGQYGEEITAVVGTGGDGGRVPAEYFATEVAAFKVPDAGIVRDALPRSMNGKVDKRQLKTRTSPGRSEAVRVVASGCRGRLVRGGNAGQR